RESTTASRSCAFNMIDPDNNGDITMRELEAVCVWISTERESTTASRKDLDSVLSNLARGEQKNLDTIPWQSI
ncbi:MAG: hypothetical protein Q9221_005898, partial [Calogaya cf. arnoldii]